MFVKPKRKRQNWKKSMWLQCKYCYSKASFIVWLFDLINSNIYSIFVAIMFALVATSTGYDIIYTQNNRKSSFSKRIAVMWTFTLNSDWFSFSGTKYPPYLAFSLYTNARKLISIRNSNSPDEIRCLHGIRVLSTQWVVFGHICLMYGLFPVQNKGSLTMVNDLLMKVIVIRKKQNQINNLNSFSFSKLSKEFYSVGIFAALISVDTFFTLSGLLVSINILKHLEK